MRSEARIHVAYTVFPYTVVLCPYTTLLLGPPSLGLRKALLHRKTLAEKSTSSRVQSRLEAREMEPLLVMMTFRETQRKPARLADPIAISDESASRAGAGICVTEQSMEPSGASDVSVHKRS